MIKLGNNDITLKVGSTDVSAAYLGSVLVYSGGTPPTPSFKWKATYTGGTTSSAQCDSTSAITQGEISLADLVAVEIGSCVGTIDSNAFRDCSSLTSVTIGNSVSIIQPSAFRNCSGLTSITCLRTEPSALGGTSVFYNTNDCPIYVPSASVSTYKSASIWSAYASRIQAIPEPSPQWVTFNSGDDISGLNVYGVKGVAHNLSNTFADNSENIYFEMSRNIVNATIGDYSSPCYTDTYGFNDNVELIFGNIGCSDYYTLPASKTAIGTIQLYIYQ